jgi:hypothetical protein
MQFSLEYRPVPHGAQWQVIATKETSTHYLMRVDHAELDVAHDPRDITALSESVRARALELFTAGRANVIAVEDPPVEITSWEREGNSAARAALAYYSRSATGEDTQ